MAYKTMKNVRHDGKKYGIGEVFSITGMKKEDVQRLVNVGAIVDPEAEAKAIAKAEEEKKKSEEQ